MVEGAERIELRHWARAQEIAERWRESLHLLDEELNQPGPSKEYEMERRILDVIAKKGPSTASDIARAVRGLSSIEADRLMANLALAGALAVLDRTRKGTVRYITAQEEM